MIPKIDSAISIFRAAASRTVPQDVCTLHTTTQHYPRSIGRQLTCSIKPAQWSTPSVKKKRQSSGGNLIHLEQQIQITLHPYSLSQMRSNPHLIFFWTKGLASSSMEKCQMSERAHLLCQHVLSSYLLYSFPPISHFKVFVFNFNSSFYLKN